MTIDDYRRNLRGVNDGKDFPPEYLAGIHDSLRKREIILPEEHGGQSGFDFAWKTLMMKSRGTGESRIVWYVVAELTQQGRCSSATPRSLTKQCSSTRGGH